MSRPGKSSAMPPPPRSRGSSQPRTPASNAEASTHHLSPDKVLGLLLIATSPASSPLCEAGLFLAPACPGRPTCPLDRPPLACPSSEPFWVLLSSGLSLGAAPHTTGRQSQRPTETRRWLRSSSNYHQLR